jgi:hypothetical protein
VKMTSFEGERGQKTRFSSNSLARFFFSLAPLAALSRSPLRHNFFSSLYRLRGCFSAFLLYKVRSTSVLAHCSPTPRSEVSNVRLRPRDGVEPSESAENLRAGAKPSRSIFHFAFSQTAKKTRRRCASQSSPAFKCSTSPLRDLAANASSFNETCSRRRRGV